MIAAPEATIPAAVMVDLELVIRPELIVADLGSMIQQRAIVLLESIKVLGLKAMVPMAPMAPMAPMTPMASMAPMARKAIGSKNTKPMGLGSMNPTPIGLMGSETMGSKVMGSRAMSSKMKCSKAKLAVV